MAVFGDLALDTMARSPVSLFAKKILKKLKIKNIYLQKKTMVTWLLTRWHAALLLCLLNSLAPQATNTWTLNSKDKVQFAANSDWSPKIKVLQKLEIMFWKEFLLCSPFFCFPVDLIAALSKPPISISCEIYCCCLLSSTPFCCFKVCCCLLDAA